MGPPVTADLHVHTTASDGTLEVEDLPAVAQDAGLSWVAVTDHDRVHPDLSAPVTGVDGVSIVRGIELRVETDAQRVDLLGYGVERTSGLDSELERLQQNRVERAAEIVGRVEERLGVDLDIELRAGIGRPHIAAAIAESEASYDYGDAFADLIGDGGPCYVARDVTGVDSGLELLTESCRVVGLAHPLRYDDPDSALRLAPRLDAVERYYPYERAVDESSVVAAVEDHDLLVTGGSDAHGTTLGAAGLSEHQFEPLRNRFDRTESAAE